MDENEQSQVFTMIRDRFDGVDRRLDQQRAAIELYGDHLNKLSIHVTKQNGRLDKAEEAIKSLFKVPRDIATKRSESRILRIQTWQVVASLAGTVIVAVVTLAVSGQL